MNNQLLSQIQNKEKVTVINETIALNFFCTIDVIGNEFIINDELYKIAGVVKDKQKEGRLYIPYTCAEDNNGYSQIWCHLKDDENNQSQNVWK